MISHTLAQHVHDRLPVNDDVRSSIRRLIRDYIGVGIAGSSTTSGAIVADFHREYTSPSREATLLAGGPRVDAHAAAYANAVASHSIELDDIDVLALFHFAPPVVSAALAAAESADLSGEEFVMAVAVGCEVMEALSEAMNPQLRDRGFHTTPVAGVFGAVASASRAFALTPEQTVNAFGIAGAHASGLMEMYGPSMQKRINPGPAAHNGILSARLAQRGFTGADSIFEGERGLFRGFAGSGSVELVGRRLAETDHLDIEFKPYACARPIHNAIDCALEIRSQLGDDIDRIVALRLFRHPMWGDFHRIDNPRTYHEAQMSVVHATAVALVDGAAFFDQFGQDRIDDPRVARLRSQVTVQNDPALARGVSCRLEAELDDGTVIQTTVDYPKGSIQNPMSEAEHRRKFELLTEGRLDSAAVLDALDDVEHLASVRHLTALLQT